MSHLMHSCLVTLLVLTLAALAVPAAPAAPPAHVVVLGDPHLPGRNLDAKRAVVDRVNGWSDVDLVAVVGDLCETTGTTAEYGAAADFMGRVRHPLALVNGNHDYVFTVEADGRRRMGTPDERSAKLDLFRETFDQPALSHDRLVGGYHLIFLGLESLDGATYATLGPDQLAWLDERLAAMPDTPTVVFCHAPLWGRGVLQMNPKLANFLVQPVEALESLVASHPQLFLWMSGHVHLGALNPAGTGPLNRFMDQVTTVNTCDMDGRSILQGMQIQLHEHDTVWTTSLYLYPDRVVTRVYDHTADSWLPALERTFPRPSLTARSDDDGDATP